MKTKPHLADLDADIRDHTARETHDNIERGMSPEEARHAALPVSLTTFEDQIAAP